VSTTLAPDGLHGLGGSAEGAGTIQLTASTPVTLVDVHYLEQRGGGDLEIAVDNKVIEKLSTRGDTKRAAFKKIVVPATRKVELRARGRVRLFGAALEASRGVVVDNLGIVNATSKGIAKYNRADHFKHQLAHRAPDLVIVMYGTNEAEWLIPRSANMVEHEQVFNEMLAAVRAANPDASCLVISPLDQLDWRKDNAPPRASVPAMVDAQHRAASAHGCAFWDVYEWMGGKGASGKWFRLGLLIKDFQHPTMEGNVRIAEALFAGLTAR
jgi:lysophospholipase L1-like esterase